MDQSGICAQSLYAPIKTRCFPETTTYQSRMMATQASNSNGNGGNVHKAYIALGSNIGDRIAMIERACAEMNRVGIKVKRTSSLFETAPMYVLDQEPFLNAACEVETTLGPIELLDALQAIENGLGRQKLIDKGPRNIDLDILLYNNERVSHPRLNIPHKLMLEREFVLRPLCQLIPHERVPLPGTNLTYISALRSLPPSETVPIVTSPLSPHVPPLTPSNPAKKTHVMAILNVTPDSFSDGGKHFYSGQNFNAEQLTSTIREFISAGATVIDVGGESTRPNATQLTPEEELSRVIPVIRHIRSLPEAENVAISIDTYRARVAAEACAAGADIINDVSAGTLDADMLSTMAATGKSVILMHMRGTPATMNKLTTYPNGVIKDVGAELLTQVRAAEEAGIPRWRMILDPGLGFAKMRDQNVELLRNLTDLTHKIEGLENFPWLIGTSRKAYIGHITGVEKASERVWGTAAAVTASVQQGADIVRVHDVKEMGQVVKMADAIYRF
ncbi:Folic acid synthesis protein fol1 [Talaromyces pinophilus]|nr:Folic acid synthesis protein fol1 [Talaromyces pinophilus]